ncbi:TetR/AcrR family transcriptional regulator [Sporomusa acidovorans]|uniref:HTH tetR-type domain-containing protein n=1 Tax=Sporomusa acidovorans (strain ATCC 49682 / DSM 3132 / Mol) TaxID=1123286 RepID=A0ABZ3J0S8_SPOA4|nr:TetR/AcrR family transcriptional regulator [Sporomusa acidovorans]OZC22782.1 fatty acid metabolism regulator protein [Sporomusa acidovorans DSM 3132]SDE50892.1 transcriptional regulator, TetR family [Sporomusa acidovorans]
MNDIKELILDKAKERMDRFGFKKTTMDEISKDCKISKKTIYEHFTDKEDMFRCLLLRECQQTMKLLFSRLENVADPFEKLILLIKTAVTYFNQDHFITRLLKDEDALFLTISNKKYHEYIDEEVISIIAGVIREGKQQGKFRDVDEKIVAYAGFKLFQAFSYARTGQLYQEQDEQHYTAVLVDFILHGLVKK